MSVASATHAGRRAAEARMLDEFELRVYTGGWAYNPDTGQDERAYDVAFTTPGRVKVATTVPADSEVGGRTATTVRRELHIPYDSPAVPAGAVAVCTYVDESSDPTLLGAELTLAGPAPGSQTTARRLLVEEVIA